MLFKPFIIVLLVLFIYCMETDGQRTMIISDWFGVGTRNVVRQTVANNAFNEQGKIVPQMLNVRKVDGKTISDCTDISGVVRKNDEEYERSNGKFRFKCENGTEIVIACIGTERTNKTVIKVGETLMKDGFWHKCTHFPDNQTAIYTEENSCPMNDKLLHIGELLHSSFLTMNCTDTGYDIVVDDDASNNSSFVLIKNISSNVTDKHGYHAFSMAQLVKQSGNKSVNNTMNVQLHPLFGSISIKKNLENNN